MRRAAVPFGVALAVGVAVALVVPPHWRAGGLPYALGHAKNVEHAAVTAAILAAAASAWILEARRGWRLLGCLAACGFGLLAFHVDPRVLLVAAPQLAVTLLLSVALRPLQGKNEGHRPDVVPPADRDLPAPAVAVALAVLATMTFVLSLRPLEIDVYHHGEVLASAVDLLRGGRPFETFLWPHGLHDTGLTALWIALTGKVGTSPIALAQATCRALGVVSAFAVAWRLFGSRRWALAASAGLVFALLVRGNAPAPAATLYQLGVLVFVSLGFAVLLGPRTEPLAGALFGLAYLFRLETGVYAVLAALAFLASRQLFAPGVSRGEAARRFGSSIVRLLTGVAATLLLFRLVLGWPGSAWLSYTLLDLPRYHRDSSGLPFPWPLRGAGPGLPLSAVGLGLGALAFALLLVIEAARRRTSAPLWFWAVFAALATHSTLDRSDEGHLLQWHALPVLAVVLVGAINVRERLGWSVPRMSLVVFLALGWIDIGSLTVPWPSRARALLTIAELRPAFTLLVEHFRPNPSVGRCEDAFFTPTEAREGSNPRFIDATCEVEGLLRAHGVTELVIVHSAPWYYVRFGLPVPTRYFTLARAYTPERQRALIEDLRARRPQAMLRVRGFAGLERLDVPDAVRVPVVDAYLRERRLGVTPTLTPIGDFYFWNEPPGRLATSRPAAEAVDSGLGIAVERAFYAPSSGLFLAEGWAADVSRQEPLRSVTPASGGRPSGDAWASLEYGRLRPDLADDCGPENGSPCGLDYTALIAPEAMAAARERGLINLTATTADGATAPLELSLAKLRLLGELSGPEWRGLAQAIKEAAALGAADRSQAKARNP